MSVSDGNAMASSTSTLARVTRRCVGFFQATSPSVVDPRSGSTTFADTRGASSPLDYVAPSSHGDWDITASQRVHTLGMVQLKAGFVLLCQMLALLIVQVTVVVSDIDSLKHRIAVVEHVQVLAAAHDQETAALARQVNELCERVASQESRISHLERSQRAETEAYRKKIRELTTRLDDGEKSRDDAIERLCQSFLNCQRSIECQAARITGVKADAARKIALLESGLAGVRAELAAVKTVSMPANAAHIDQAAKEAKRLWILESIAQGIEDGGMAQEIEKPCPLRPIARNLASATSLFAASASSGRSAIALPNYNETTVKSLGIAEDRILPSAFTQPCANEIPVTSMIPIEITPILTIPISTIPMERLIPANGSDKENSSCNSSTMTFQHIHPIQVATGRSLDVSDKNPTASLKKVQSHSGLPSKVSAALKPRGSMLPAPRKSRYPSTSQFDAVGDASGSPDVKPAANRPAVRSETRTEQWETIKYAPIVASRSLSEAALSKLVGGEPRAVLPASSSLTVLDAALQAMQPDGDDLLAPMPVLNDDLSFSMVTPIPMVTKTKRKRDDKYENVHVLPKQRKVEVKPLRSPLKPTRNAVPLPASSSPTALDAALQGEGEVLTLLPGLDYPSVDFSFTRITSVSPRKPPCKHENIFVSPVKTSTVKPSRRL